MQIHIKADIKKLSRGIEDKYKKQIPFAASVAINKTAFEAQRVVKERLQKDLDRPTPFTIKGVQVKKSTKRQLFATVYFEEKRAGYMERLIEGGVYSPSKKAFALPTNIPLNKYGNLPRGKIQKLLDKGTYFSGIPKGLPNATSGIWQRIGKGKNQKLKKVITYKDKLTYPIRFRFGEIVQKVIRERFAKEFDIAIKKAISSAK